jgi:hypothetical protein
MCVLDTQQQKKMDGEKKEKTSLWNERGFVVTTMGGGKLFLR